MLQELEKFTLKDISNVKLQTQKVFSKPFKPQFQDSGRGRTQRILNHKPARLRTNLKFKAPEDWHCSHF